METITYQVSQIDGDYAWLIREDHPLEEPKCVARALLPMEIEEGSRLLYECFEYSMI